jgi:hypothetical protein
MRSFIHCLGICLAAANASCASSDGNASHDAGAQRDGGQVQMRGSHVPGPGDAATAMDADGLAHGAKPGAVHGAHPDGTGGAHARAVRDSGARADDAGAAFDADQNGSSPLDGSVAHLPEASFVPFDDVATLTAAVDSSGAIHVAVTAFGQGGFELVYGECDKRCGNASSWSLVDLTPADPSNTPTIGVTDAGKPRILFATDTGGAPGYYYAECDSACIDPANWTAVRLTNRISPLVLAPPRLPFAVSPDGSAAFQYNDSNADQVIYCKASCSDGMSWSMVPLPGDAYTQPVTLAFAGNDSLQVLQRHRNKHNELLTWSQCSGDCTSPQSWTESETLWATHDDTAIQADLATPSQGAARIAVYAVDPNGSSTDKIFAYLTCDRDCLQAASWTTTKLSLGANLADTGFSLVLDSKGYPILAYAHDRTVTYASCSSDCASDSAWQSSISVSRDVLEQAVPLPVPAQCASATWSIDWGPDIAIGRSDQLFVSFSARKVAVGRFSDAAVCGDFGGEGFLLMN